MCSHICYFLLDPTSSQSSSLHAFAEMVSLKTQGTDGLLDIIAQFSQISSCSPTRLALYACVLLALPSCVVGG